MVYLVVLLGIAWVSMYYTAYLIYKQKMGPYYEKLPTLRETHVNLAFFWLVFLSANIGLDPFVFGLLIPTSILVIWTGVNLKRNKPTAVFVHVGCVFITTIMALVILVFKVVNGGLI